MSELDEERGDVREAARRIVETLRNAEGQR